MQFVLPLRGATQLGPSHFLFGAGQHAGKLVDDTIKFMCSSWTLSLARLYSLYSIEPASSMEKDSEYQYYAINDNIDDAVRVALKGPLPIGSFTSVFGAAQHANTPAMRNHDREALIMLL